MIGFLHHFLPELLSGFLVNLEIALGAVAIGLSVGIPLALLRQKLPATRRVVWACVRLMQAAPTYVIMFFALSVLPRNISLFGAPRVALVAVVLAQAVYMTSYVADNFYRALQHFHRDEREHALLFLPNLLRGFVVVVMSSGFGAAIGVSEAVSVTMRQAERLHSVGERVLLFVFVIAFFIAVFASINALIGRFVQRLSLAAKVRVQSA